MLQRMKCSKLASSLLLCGALGLHIQAAQAAERISDFSLIDHHGEFFQLSRETKSDAIV